MKWIRAEILYLRAWGYTWWGRLMDAWGYPYLAVAAYDKSVDLATQSVHALCSKSK